MKKISDFKALAILLTLTLFMLSFPHIYRHNNGNDAIITSKSYYHASIVEQILENNFVKPELDKAALGKRSYDLDPYDYLLSFFSIFFGVGQSSKLVPFILGLLSSILFFLILRKMKCKTWISLFSSLVLVSSPVFIRVFTVSDSFSLLIFLNLTIFYLLFLDVNKAGLISFPLVLLIPFFGLFPLFIFVILLFAYLFMAKYFLRFTISLFSCFLGLFLWHKLVYSSQFFEVATFLQRNIFREFVSSLGAEYGFSIFMLVLAFFGIIITWDNKKQNMLFYVFILVAIGGFVYLDNLYNAHLNLALALFAGLAIYELAKRKWELQAIRDITLTILFCGFLFSSLSYLVQISNDYPDSSMLEGLGYLNNINKTGIVLSHFSNGFTIEYASKMPAFVDTLKKNSPGINYRFEVSNEIFSSRSLKKTRQLLEDNKIGYILIESRMVDGLVWSDDDEGLLFLLQNDETFKNVYNSPNIQIWEVILGTKSGEGTP